MSSSFENRAVLQSYVVIGGKKQSISKDTNYSITRSDLVEAFKNNLKEEHFVELIKLFKIEINVNYNSSYIRNLLNSKWEGMTISLNKNLKEELLSRLVTGEFIEGVKLRLRVRKR